MKNYFPKRPSGASLHNLSTLCDVPVGFVPPTFEALYCFIWGHRRVAVARYRMICLVLVNSYLFPLPFGAGSTVPHEVFNVLSVIFLHHFSSTRYWAAVTLCCGRCNILSFPQVECTFANILTCVHLPVMDIILNFWR